MTQSQEVPDGFHRWVMRKRCHHGMTLKMLGNYIGVSETQVRRIENGTQKPSPKTYNKLIKIFSIKDVYEKRYQQAN